MLELVNTSLPNGLIPGTHGFATVAMTKGLPDALRHRLEALCAYTHKTSAHDASYYSQNPVNWFHAVLPQGEHVLGRVAASDFDYTGRTNRLARLLVFPGREMPAVGGAAILKNETADLSAPWSGDPRYLPADKAKTARLAALQPPTFSSPENWTSLFGPDGAQLAQRFAWQLEKNLKGGGKPIYFKTSAAFDQNGTKLLGLFADIIDLLPAELRTSVTFSTYPDAFPAGTNCLLRGAFDGDRNFAIASSTQPWVDCEHAKVVHPEMLPSEAAPKPKAAVSDKSDVPASLDAPAAPQSLDSPNAAQDRKPLRLKQQPSAAPQRSHGSRSPYLPPPRSDDKKFGIIVAACVVAILALATGIFMVWQDGEKKKRKAEKQAELLRQQEAESAQQGAMLENAITNYALAVNQAIGQLEKMKSKIRMTDNPDHFGNEELPMEQGRVREARRAAKSQNVKDDILKTYDERFDNAVVEVDTAIKKRKMELEAARKNGEEQAKAERDKAEAESNPKEVVAETTAQEPAKPVDTRPAFCNAREVKVVGINEIKDHDFIRHYETMTVFFYADGNRKDFASEEVSMKQMSTSCIWSPKPDDVVKKSAGLFTIWYSEKDKTAYWLWNLPKNAEKGEQWFAPAESTNDKKVDFAKWNLKQKVFGNAAYVYSLYEQHLGKPTFTITRVSKGGTQDKISSISITNRIETCNIEVTCKLFEPDKSAIQLQRNKLVAAVEEKNSALANSKEPIVRDNAAAREFEAKVAKLKKALVDIDKFMGDLKKAEKERNKSNREEASRKQKEAVQEQQKLVTDIAAKSIEIARAFAGVLSIDESALLRCKKPDDIDAVLKEKKLLDKNGKALEKDLKKETQKLQDDLNTAMEKLTVFDATFEKQWRAIAEQSRYAVTAVVGSKETKGKK